MDDDPAFSDYKNLDIGPRLKSMGNFSDIFYAGYARIFGWAAEYDD